MIPALPRQAAVQLLIIRGAMLLGLVLFGVSTLYIKRREATSSITGETAQLFSYMFIGLAAFAIAGMMFIRARLGEVKEPRRIVPMYLIGYALAESAALFSAAMWYLGAAGEWFIAGLVLMVVAFQILPVRRSA